MKEELKEHYGNKVSIIYQETIRLNLVALDERLSGEMEIIGIEGILENDTDNFVYVRNAERLDFNPSCDSIERGRIKRMSSNKYINKSKILEITMY